MMGMKVITTYKMPLLPARIGKEIISPSKKTEKIRNGTKEKIILFVSAAIAMSSPDLALHHRLIGQPIERSAKQPMPKPPSRASRPHAVTTTSRSWNG
jgi:hypothetical protein